MPLDAFFQFNKNIRNRMFSRFYWERQRKQRDFHKTTFPILFLTLVGSSRSICPRSYSAIICLRVNHTIMSASKQSMSPFDFGLCFLYRPGPWGLASSSEHCCASRSAKVCFYLFLSLLSVNHLLWFVFTIIHSWLLCLVTPRTPSTSMYWRSWEKPFIFNQEREWKSKGMASPTAAYCTL